LLPKPQNPKPRKRVCIILFGKFNKLIQLQRHPISDRYSSI